MDVAPFPLPTSILFGLDTGPPGDEFEVGSELTVEVNPFKGLLLRSFCVSSSMAENFTPLRLEVGRVYREPTPALPLPLEEIRAGEPELWDHRSDKAELMRVLEEWPAWDLRQKLSAEQSDALLYVLGKYPPPLPPRPDPEFCRYEGKLELSCEEPASPLATLSIVLDHGVVVEAHEPVRLTVRIKKPCSRITMTALADMHPADAARSAIMETLHKRDDPLWRGYADAVRTAELVRANQRGEEMRSDVALGLEEAPPWIPPSAGS